MKHLGVTKTFKEIKFGLIWDKVKAKKKKKKKKIFPEIIIPKIFETSSNFHLK